MEHKLIANLTPVASLWADGLNYILVIRSHPAQLIKNGRPSYHSTLEACFQYYFEYQLRFNLADGKDKTIEQILEIIKTTRMEIKQIISPFEEIITPQHKPVEPSK
ncbi:MAG: hypothetical protein EXS69_02485 [Candidatus Zambryskibacteria bacterium]|nr:hypothetical protein [Candidatus Zambryskibacteria bacterium]